MCLTNRMNKYYYIESFRFFPFFIYCYRTRFNIMIDTHHVIVKVLRTMRIESFETNMKIVSDCEPSVKIHFYSTSVFFCTSSYCSRELERL